MQTSASMYLLFYLYFISPENNKINSDVIHTGLIIYYCQQLLMAFRPGLIFTIYDTVLFCDTINNGLRQHIYTFENDASL